MIDDLLEKCDYPTGNHLTNEPTQLIAKDVKSIARLISAAENFYDLPDRKSVV